MWNWHLTIFWSEINCVCRHTLLNQHWTVLKVKLTSLSSRVAVKSTFDHFWSEINIFDLTGCRQINIWLFLKWSWTSLSLYVDMKSVFHCHMLKSVFHCHTLTWNQYLIYCFCCRIELKWTLNWNIYLRILLQSACHRKANHKQYTGLLRGNWYNLSCVLHLQYYTSLDKINVQFLNSIYDLWFSLQNPGPYTIYSSFLLSFQECITLMVMPWNSQIVVQLHCDFSNS